MPYYTETTPDEYDEMQKRHRDFFAGGKLRNPWEEEDDQDGWCEGWTGEYEDREW